MKNMADDAVNLKLLYVVFEGRNLWSQDAIA